MQTLYSYFCLFMPSILPHYNLKKLNTFGIEACCDYYTEIRSVSDFKSLVNDPLFRSSKKLIIGGGSNLLFVSDFKGIVVRNCLKGIEIKEETSQEVVVCAAAGENWHEFVTWCISRGFAGLENLSLIPGCVGASPMQNIGAYGCEIKDVFESLDAYDIANGTKRVFTKEDCHFGYRESVFKRELKDQYLIASVSYRLKKQAPINVSYGAISAELKAMHVSSPGIKDVSEAVIRIRKSKLPDPNVLGNAGSFFKNPEVQAVVYENLKKNFPDLVAYPLENGAYKLAAGWLIEQCGLKGFELNGAAVHNKQALVLVNLGQCKGKDIYHLSEYVLKTVRDKFGVELEREVNIIE